MLPRNFLRRPEIRALVPDLKLLLLCLYVSCESHIGAYLPGGIGDEVGLEAEALTGGMTDLIRRGLIAQDEKTGEIFIMSFFRDNSFNTPARKGQARDDFQRVESLKLKTIILEAVSKNEGCGLTPGDLNLDPAPVDKSPKKPGFEEKQAVSSLGLGLGIGIGEAAAPAPAPTAQGQKAAAASSSFFQKSEQKKTPRARQGVRVWVDDDIAEVDALIETHGLAAVREAASRLAAALGKLPLPSQVGESILMIKKHEEAAAAAAAAAAARNREDEAWLRARSGPASPARLAALEKLAQLAGRRGGVSPAADAGKGEVK